VELVKNRKTKEPFNTMKDKVSGTPLLVDKVTGRMMTNGVYMQAWVSHFVIAPPLIIRESEIDEGVAAFDEALSIADAEVEA
jgi:taurine--2-oxoglutarate transaminase